MNPIPIRGLTRWRVRGRVKTLEARMEYLAQKIGEIEADNPDAGALSYLRAEFKATRDAIRIMQATLELDLLPAIRALDRDEVNAQDGGMTLQPVPIDHAPPETPTRPYIFVSVPDAQPELYQQAMGDTLVRRGVEWVKSLLPAGEPAPGAALRVAGMEESDRG